MPRLRANPQRTLASSPGDRDCSAMTYIDVLYWLSVAMGFVCPFARMMLDDRLLGVVKNLMTRGAMLNFGANCERVSNPGY